MPDYASHFRFARDTTGTQSRNQERAMPGRAEDSQKSSADVYESATMSCNHGQFPRIHETSGKQDREVQSRDSRR